MVSISNKSKHPFLLFNIKKIKDLGFNIYCENQCLELEIVNLEAGIFISFVRMYTDPFHEVMCAYLYLLHTSMKMDYTKPDSTASEKRL